MQTTTKTVKSNFKTSNVFSYDYVWSFTDTKKLVKNYIEEKNSKAPSVIGNQVQPLKGKTIINSPTRYSTHGSYGKIQ